MTSAADVLAELRRSANPANVAGMARFGIRPQTEVLGGPNVPGLRAMAKRLGRDQALARGLWVSGVHEARLLATMVADPGRFPRRTADRWARSLDSWDVCDQFCGNLVDRTPYAYEAAATWAGRRQEFVKRAGFALMAELAVHDKQAPDDRFLAFIPLIERHAMDQRNFVRKAVNWALREIGKRNGRLHGAALEAADRIKGGPRGGRWVGSDALHELMSDAVRARIAKRRD